MESQQMMEFLLAMHEEMNARTKTMLASMDADQARMKAEGKAWREEMKASGNAWRKETMARKGSAEARLEEVEPASVTRRLRWPMIKKSQWRTSKYGRSRNRGKGVGTNDEIWPRCAARRNRSATWTRDITGKDRNGPRGKIYAEETRSPPAEGRTILRDAELY
jgi:hypothetical protein